MEAQTAEGRNTHGQRRWASMVAPGFAELPAAELGAGGGLVRRNVNRPRAPARRPALPSRPGPRLSAAPRRGAHRLRHGHAHPAGGLPELPRDGDGERADRRDRRAADRIAQHEEGKRVDAGQARGVGPGQRAPGELGPVRPRLDLRVRLRPDDLAGRRGAPGAAESVESRNERPDPRESRSREAHGGRGFRKAAGASSPAGSS